MLWTQELCEKDSDGDGLTKGEELGDPCSQWSELSNTPLRLTMLSHPGRSHRSRASAAPNCNISTVAPATPPIVAPETAVALPPGDPPATPTMLLGALGPVTDELMNLLFFYRKRLRRRLSPMTQSSPPRWPLLESARQAKLIAEVLPSTEL